MWYERCSQRFYEVKVTFYNWKSKRKVLSREIKFHKYKSKDWLKSVTSWVWITTITHFIINSSTVNNLLHIPWWGRTLAYHSGNLPKLQGQGSAPFLVLCAQGYATYSKAVRERWAQGSFSHQPANSAGVSSPKWALASNVYLFIILWSI